MPRPTCRRTCPESVRHRRRWAATRRLVAGRVLGGPASTERLMPGTGTRAPQLPRWSGPFLAWPSSIRERMAHERTVRRVGTHDNAALMLARESDRYVREDVVLDLYASKTGAPRMSLRRAFGTQGAAASRPSGGTRPRAASSNATSRLGRNLDAGGVGMLVCSDIGYVIPSQTRFGRLRGAVGSWLPSSLRQPRPARWRSRSRG